MRDDELLELAGSPLTLLGFRADDGEEFRRPPLDVLRYFARPVRLSRIPILGRALGLVAVVRQPIDLGLANDGYRALLERLAMAVNGRYPPRLGLSVGLTALVLTPEPIGADEEGTLATALGGLKRSRCVPLGLLRVNLGQEALSFALARGPDDLFPEPAALTDALIPHFRRFVPLLPIE